MCMLRTCCLCSGDALASCVLAAGGFVDGTECGKFSNANVVVRFCCCRPSLCIPILLAMRDAYAYVLLAFSCPPSSLPSPCPSRLSPSTSGSLFLFSPLLLPASQSPSLSSPQSPSPSPSPPYHLTFASPCHGATPQCVFQGEQERTSKHNSSSKCGGHMAANLIAHHHAPTRILYKLKAGTRGAKAGAWR